MTETLSTKRCAPSFPLPSAMLAKRTRPLAGVALAAMLAGAGAISCKKDHDASGEDPRRTTAASVIRAGIEKPEAALCTLKFEFHADVRTFGFPKPLARMFCRKSEAPPTMAKCFEALETNKVAYGIDKDHPECLVLMDGRIEEDDAYATGISFPCGTFSSVEIKKLSETSPDRLKVEYTLGVEKDTGRTSAVERQCGDVAWPAPQSKSVSLFKEGDRWVLPGH